VSNSRTLSDFIGSSGTPAFSSNTTFSANVAVTGAATVANTLAVTGIATFSNTVGIGTATANQTALHIKADWVSGNSTIKIQGVTDNTAGLGLYDTAGARKSYLVLNSGMVSLATAGLGINLSVDDNATSSVYVANTGAVTMPKQPSFHAYGCTVTANGSYMVYPTASYNVGNNYSTSTGRFTAPVAGTYLFGWTSIGGSTNDTYRLYFRINGSNVGGGDVHFRMDTTATGSEYATNGTYVYPRKLNVNDYVQLWFTSDNGNSIYPGSPSATNDYLQFWGHLLA